METNDFHVVFEDDYLIVLNKKPGLLVVPTPKKERHTLTHLVNEYLKSKKEEALPCHRLDRDTSGLIVYAKNKMVQQDIMRQFQLRKVKKKYLAVVQGRVRKTRMTIKGYIKPRGKPPKFAVTHFRIVRRFKKFTILEVEPVTGRSNQIRIHLSSIHHPIIGERKYAVAKDWPLKFKRLCLHSYSVQLRHPVSRDMLSLETDVPSYFNDFLGSMGFSAKIC